MALGLALDVQNLSSRLTVLVIPHNRVGDTGAWAVASLLRLSELKTVDLTSNDIGVFGGISIAEALQVGDCTLETLILDSNPLGLSGGTEVSLVSHNAEGLYCCQKGGGCAGLAELQ